ncbi:MAG: response regulator, partial [Myxococcota bacterium]
MTSSQDTALGTARARFVDALPRKGRELKAAVALLAGAPEARRPREELRRRLHALYASAQVFRIGSLADALKDAIKRLDRARDEERSLTQEDLDALSHLAATLPALTSSVGGEASVQDQQTTVPGSYAAVEPLDPNEPPPPPRVPSRSPPSSPRDRQKTLTGIIAQRRTKSEERLGAAKERLARLVETLAEEKDTVEVTPFRSQLQAATPPEVRARVEDGGSGSAVKPMDAAEREARNERAEALTPVARLETPEMLDDGMAQAKETLPVGEALWMGEAEESEPAGRSEGPSIREAVPTISGASVGEGPAGEGASGLGTAGQDVADDAGDDAGDDAVPSGGAATGVDSLEEAIAENASTREAAAREAPTHEAAIGDSPRSEAQLPESDGPKADAARRPPHAPGTFSGGGAPRRIAALDTVLSVLVVDSVEWQARMVGALPSEHFEVAAASDPEAALRLARTTAPDVVVGDRSLLVEADIDFVGRLRSDPLTDFVPVIALVDSAAMSDLVAVREDGIDEILEKPFDASTLIRAIRKVTGTLPEEQLFDEFGELTLSELADRLATEIKRGIADSAERGRDTKIAMGDGVELLAAAWSTIARVRAHVAQRSGGKVRYRDQPRRGGPAVMALVDDDAAATDVEVDLTGRRIVVADDDPAVVWFFAGVLREAGATVIEAENGREAFEAARRRAPDAIISDILMPELDGFGLCRALRRDPALSHVPVILISWKEDFLQRMRELSAGASGYLRKEAGSGQILEKVREVLRPRAQLEARLKAGGDVRGRIERTGILTLLRSVAACRPNARVTARDAWNLFEVDLREGNLVDLTRTATDGSFARGPRALPQLLGAQAGRFTVSDAEGPLRATFEQPLESELGRSADQLGAVLDAVSGTNLPLASNIDFRPDVLHALEHTSPEPVRALVERLAQGEAPREILADGSTSASALESALGDLARHGAILGVQGPAGEDRIAIALEDRRAGRDIPSVAPPPRDSGTADDVRPSVLAAMKAIAPPLDPAAAEEAEDERPPRERKTSEEVAALDDPFTAPEAGSTPPGAELEQLVRASVAPEEPA